MAPNSLFFSPRLGCTKMADAYHLKKEGLHSQLRISTRRVLDLARLCVIAFTNGLITSRKEKKMKREITK